MFSHAHPGSISEWPRPAVRGTGQQRFELLSRVGVEVRLAPYADEAAQQKRDLLGCVAIGPADVLTKPGFCGRRRWPSRAA